MITVELEDDKGYSPYFLYAEVESPHIGTVV